MPMLKPARRRGDPSTTRQRKSQRTLKGRAFREAYDREVGLDRDHSAKTHAALVAWWGRNLEKVRQRWLDRATAVRALADLRAALPNAVSGKVRDQMAKALDALSASLDDARPPAWMHTADDHWLVDAQHELDDDELANLLSPAGYRRDREAALRAVRERRRKISRRR